MQKELEEIKNLVHALEERITGTELSNAEINTMTIEIHKIQDRLDILRKNNIQKELKIA